MSYSEIANQTKYPFILPKLPYNNDALSPYISKETMEYHYGKHHNNYVSNLNKLLENEDLDKSSLETIIEQSYDQEIIEVYNNACQVWNHTFYWHSMVPNSSYQITDEEFLAAVQNKFGGIDKLKQVFKEAAISHFGSGWVWLVLDDDSNMQIFSTSDADNPLIHLYYPLLTCDVWEHSYYIDVRNRRTEYVENFVEKLINWEFVVTNFNNGKSYVNESSK